MKKKNSDYCSILYYRQVGAFGVYLRARCISNFDSLIFCIVFLVLSRLHPLLFAFLMQDFGVSDISDETLLKILVSLPVYSGKTTIHKRCHLAFYR